MIFRTITNDITGANKSIGLLGKSLNDFKGIINSFKQNGFVNTLLNTPLINIDTDAIELYNNAIKTSVPYEQALAVARRTTNAETIALIESYHGAEVQIERVTAAQKVSAIAAKAHSVALKAVSIASNMILFTAIFKGIQLATTAINNWINRSKYAIEAMEKAQQTITDAQDNLKEISTAIKDNKDRFLELSEGVNKFSKNIKLSEDEYAEYLSISNKLAEISPELVSGYTDQGDALLYIGNTAEETSEKLNKVLETEKALAQQVLIDNMDDVAKGIYYEAENASNQIKILEDQLNDISSVSTELKDLIEEADDGIDTINFGTGSGLNLDFNEMEQLKNAIRNSGAKISEDEVFDVMSFSPSDAVLVQKAIEDFYSQLDRTRENESAAYVNGIKKDIQVQENAIKNAYSKINSNLSAWVKSTYEYDFLDESQKNLIEALIPNMDWYSIKNETGAKFISAAEYEQYIRENIITPLMGIPDDYQDIVNQKFAQLLEFETDDINIADFVFELENYLNGLGVTINLTPLIGDTNEIKESYEQITNDAALKFIENNSKNYALLYDERKALDDFAKQNSINTKDEIVFWSQCLEESNTREQAIEKYLSTVNTIIKNPVSSLSITETVDQINTQLKPAFDSLKSAYQDIFSLDENTGEKLFSLDDVDISTFESIRSDLEKLGEIDGITVDYSSFERFVAVLSDTSSTAEEVQQQFDNLATSIIYTTDCTNMSAETYDLLVKSLSEMGVTNADEVLNNLKDIQEELVSIGYDVASITAEEAAELIRLSAVSADTAEYLKMYLVQKELAQNPLDTMADITALEGLCNALGMTGELYRNVIALKNAFDAKERGVVSAGIDASIEYYQGKIAELANGQADFKFSFSVPDTSGSSSSPSSSAKDTTEAFDWIEQAIENVEKEIENLDEIADSAYSTFSQKNEALAQEISKVSEEIDLQQKAYDEYMRKADSIGLSDDYKELVQNGAINIEDITDENLQDMIDAYQKWYDKAQDASDAIKELKTDMKDLYVSAYELQTDSLKERLDSDSITQKQYLEGLKAAYEQFYADLEDFAQQYHEAVLEYLDEEKGYLNDVASAAASLLDTEIDRINDDAEEQESRIQKQIDLLEAKKKPLQDELDALEDKAKREEQILNLQKAQYALARAEYQRPKLVNYMPDTIVI